MNLNLKHQLVDLLLISFPSRILLKACKSQYLLDYLPKTFTLLGRIFFLVEVEFLETPTQQAGHHQVETEALGPHDVTESLDVLWN